jgi:Zn-finger nucleic acid-binding protein
MLCKSCGLDIPSTFKFALEQNKCPGCGGDILDEESLAVIEKIEDLILENVSVRKETANKIALVMVSNFGSIMGPGQFEKSKKKVVPNPTVLTDEDELEEEVIEETEEETEEESVEAKAISQREREAIMEDAVQKKYGMVTGGVIDKQKLIDIYNQSEFEEFNESNISVVELERQARLMKQKSVIEGGGGAFRRSS